MATQRKRRADGISTLDPPFRTDHQNNCDVWQPNDICNRRASGCPAQLTNNPAAKATRPLETEWSMHPHHHKFVRPQSAISFRQAARPVSSQAVSAPTSPAMARNQNDGGAASAQIASRRGCKAGNHRRKTPGLAQPRPYVLELLYSQKFKSFADAQ